ncbi:MAG: 7-cyano-7-deazaguanine synthase [Campylobacterota bacterium]|nr:7-cyano-7-deazaguanine synthase [Campylobacterota bacterium]
MKAIALFSGGLDSTLAMKLIIDQGIEVLACNISTGFGATKDRQAHMQSMCDQVGAKLKIIDIQNEYLQDVLFSPKHGYGKHFNPCIDCHAKMFAVAKRLMEEEGASFLISGEVLGQRPMSQNSDALKTVLNEGNVEGLLLRPMSAKCLEPTIAETQGWVERDRLEGISGRNRERQMELAGEFGLTDYESPGGGCLLTDENFARKMRDFTAHDTFEVRDIPVVKYGRQLRLPDGAKLVIGRNQEDNAQIEVIENDKYVHIKTDGIPGPHSLLSRDASEADKALSTKLVLTYCKTNADSTYTLDYEGESVEGSPFQSKDGFTQYFV